jgi:hypothetical protein
VVGWNVKHKHYLARQLLLGIPKHTPPLPPHPVKVPWPVEPAKIEEKKTRGGSSNPPKKVGERVSSHSFLEGKKEGGKNLSFIFREMMKEFHLLPSQIPAKDTYHSLQSK